MKATHHIVAALAIILAMTALASCSETDSSSDEFDNWQERNEAYFSQQYQQARTAIAQGSSQWQVLTKWSLNDSIATNAEDHIVVEVLGEGKEGPSPMYTDSVSVHFRGRTMPTAASAEGYELGSSYEGTFFEEVARARRMAISSAPDGLTTALLHMRIGDHWRVYVPYQLGYGITTYTVSTTTGWASTSVPAYTTLVYDLRLVGYSRPNNR